MKTLEEQVRNYYISQAMPDERIETIIYLQESASTKRRLFWAIGIAAAAGLSLLIAGLFGFGRSSHGDRTHAVLAEIAKNHSKQIEPEVLSDRYEEVQAKLSKIDFSVRPIAKFLLDDFQLVGGRYCSVQSEFAAQLKLREKGTGEICTLYVVPLTPVLRQVKADTRVIKGVRVQVWDEDERLFGLARYAATKDEQ